MTVVLHHCWSLSNQPGLPPDDRIPLYWVVEGFGLWGVMLFFMLSGYLLADTFWREEKADLRVYAIRRFFRIAPAYYVCLAILFLFFASTRLTFSEQGAQADPGQRAPSRTTSSPGRRARSTSTARCGR